MKKFEGSTPTVSEPNGHKVTMKDIYAALYEKEIADAKRYSSLSDSINLVSERMNTHEETHNIIFNQEVVEKRETVNTKKLGLLGVVSTIIGAVVGGIIAAVKGGII